MLCQLDRDYSNEEKEAGVEKRGEEGKKEGDGERDGERRREIQGEETKAFGGSLPL